MDKKIFLTGASKGLGLAMLQHLVKADYQVYAVARKLSDELALAMEQHPGKIEFKSLDLTQLEATADYCRELLAQHKFYGLINNAGMAHDGLVVNNDPVQIQKMVTLNFVSPMLLCRLFAKHFIPQRRGRIINISSIAANKMYKGLATYGATKAGLDSFTKALAKEVGSRNITANVIAPGFIPTSMNSTLSAAQLETIRKRSPLQQLPQVQDVAQMTLFLLSEAAQRLTGTVMVVDSGQNL